MTPGFILRAVGRAVGSAGELWELWDPRYPKSNQNPKSKTHNPKPKIQNPKGPLSF